MYWERLLSTSEEGVSVVFEAEEPEVVVALLEHEVDSLPTWLGGGFHWELGMDKALHEECCSGSIGCGLAGSMLGCELDKSEVLGFRHWDSKTEPVLGVSSFYTI